MFIRGMSEIVKAKIKHFGTDIDPGDILFHKRRLHHRLASQSHDASVPIFHDGELVAFVLHGAPAGRRRHDHGGHDDIYLKACSCRS